MKKISNCLASVLAAVALLCAQPIMAQSVWKFRKEQEKIIAVNPVSGKESVLFKGEKGTTIEDGDTTDVDISYSIVSYVGSYLTVLKSYYSFTLHAAHDIRERSFEVVDAGTGKTVRLTDLFNEKDILNALLQDSYIKGALKEGLKPKTLAELNDNLTDTDMARFGDYMYGSFAFHHVEPGKVAIRMGLAYNYEVARGAFTQLGFFLPVPEKLKAMLPAAVANKTLMKDLLPRIPQIE